MTLELPQPQAHNVWNYTPLYFRYVHVRNNSRLIESGLQPQPLPDPRETRERDRKTVVLTPT